MNGDAPEAPACQQTNSAGIARRSLDELLECLEGVLLRLADPAAPLDQAVSDYEQAGRLLAAAEARMEAASKRISELELGRR
jgi:exonuclease VII small subunit